MILFMDFVFAKSNVNEYLNASIAFSIATKSKFVNFLFFSSITILIGIFPIKVIGIIY